jgi:hypothetical protein
MLVILIQISVTFVLVAIFFVVNELRIARRLDMESWEWAR